MKRKLTMLQKEWKTLLLISVFFTITELTWYDSVKHIGAAKTTAINTPLEILTIAGFAFLILHERLTRTQLIGSGIVFAGVVISVGIYANIGIGEVEAIISAFTSAAEITLVTKLLFKYNTVECTALTLCFSGVSMFVLVWFFTPVPDIAMQTWFLLLAYPLVPMILFWLYYLSTNKIGASLTSIIASSSIIITLVAQTILVQFHIPVQLPDNLAVAFVGGIVSTAGIIVIYGLEKHE